MRLTIGLITLVIESNKKSSKLVFVLFEILLKNNFVIFSIKIEANAPIKKIRKP